jgi:hypothetical protein
MERLKLANKLDPTLTIPEREMKLYKDYLENRSGGGVIMEVPIDTTDLKQLFPCRDKILLSIEAYAEVRIQVGNKVKTYTWSPHVLLSDHGLGFIGASPICLSPAYYVPWPFISYQTVGKKFQRFFEISPRAGDFTHGIDLHVKSSYESLDQLPIKDLISQSKAEMINETVIKLRSLETLPKWKEYRKRYENVPKSIYGKALKVLKQTPDNV